MGVTWDDEEAVVILAKWRCASLTEAGWSHLSSSMRLLFKEMMKMLPRSMSGPGNEQAQGHNDVRILRMCNFQHL